LKQLKFFIFDWGTLISIILAVAGFATLTIRPEVSSQAALSGVGILLGLVYFLQKQRLEETRLFKELFVDFNKRYDEINRKLDDILRKEGAELAPKDRATIIEYLNLCAEEYLFYKRGYIHPAAWTTWNKGMIDILSKRRVLPLAKEELKEDLYYGLDRVLLPELQESHPAKDA
jgi:hypothetical protein